MRSSRVLVVDTEPELENTPMTDNMMTLRALVEKAPDADLPREMVGYARQRLMELEVGSRAGAEYGEKDPRWQGASSPAALDPCDPGRQR